MIHPLDTNVCIHLLNERHPSVLQHFRSHTPAEIARAHDATLVTHNVGEFSRVAGLRLEDWEGG
ncbi:MAG: hypothetical protein KGZ83_04155 [Sulfuricella sp.]|nr:hypothetical protein [Sulfuricella sp.]